MAQEALVSAAGKLPGSKNVMIILSDGDATASASSGQIVADNTCSSKTAGSCLNGTGTSSSNPAGTANGVCYGYNCPAYPSARGDVRAGCVGGAAGHAGGDACLYHWFRVGDIRVHVGPNLHLNRIERRRGGMAWWFIRAHALQRDCGDGFERKHILFR